MRNVNNADPRAWLQTRGDCHHIRRMCGRYASFLPAEALARLFGTTGPLPNLEPTWNMAPTKDAPIVRFDPETGERRLEVAKWGLVPFFTKDLAKARKPINARSETVARSPLFKEAFARRRCLVPAAAYYEWRHDPSGKTPFAIARKDGEPVALGGMWEEWRSPMARRCAHSPPDHGCGSAAFADPGADAGHHRAGRLEGLARRRGRRRDGPAPSPARRPAAGLAGRSEGQQRQE